MSGPTRVQTGFEVLTTRGADGVLIRPSGELDLATFDRLEGAIAEASGAGERVVLDLGALTFIDARGLRLLLRAREALGDRLLLLPGRPEVQRIFALTRTQESLGFAPGVRTPEDQASANVIHLRELWQAYCSGGVAALADVLNRTGTATPSTDVAGPVWGAAELSDFWSGLVSVTPLEQALGSCRMENVGDNLLVEWRLPTGGERPRVRWSLFVFAGRTFIRAASFASEAEARAHAGTASRGAGGASGTGRAGGAGPRR